MHRTIGQFVSDLYYADVNGGRGLEHGVKDEERTIELARYGGPNRVFWIDVPGRERQDSGSTSWWNREEVDLVWRLLERFENELGHHNKRYSCGVIAAYAAQRDHLQGSIVPTAKKWCHVELTDHQKRPQVAAVDAFQGKQKDIIFYSMVRVGDGNKKWISDPQRLNVAFSRARRFLVIVGSQNSARRSERLARILEKIPNVNILSVEEALR